MRSRSALARTCLRRLGALGAVLRRLALAFRLHPVIDRLAVLFGQVGAAEADIDDIDAETLGLHVTSSRICCMIAARSAEMHGLQLDIADDAAQAAADHRAEPGAHHPSVSTLW